MKKTKIYYRLLLFLPILFVIKIGYAQVPTYNGFPPTTAQPTAQQPAEQSSGQQPAAGRQIASGTSGGAQKGFSMNKYDPYLDNHLKAPPPGHAIGLFGKPIKEVENILRQYGAKNYSYAFGKYSRMSLSAYLITMYFDRERRLGGISVEPMKPYKIIAPEARKFFKDLFLKKGDISKFKTIIAGNRLEMRYSPTISEAESKFGSSVTQEHEEEP
ncbi:MAG: hypothetical protein Kow0029_13040 [Candidatus Rifleibacteriota bacterium]